MFECRGKVEEPGTRDKNTRVWRHFLGLVKVAIFRAKCLAACPRYGYVSQTTMDIFDCASAGNQEEVHSITVVFHWLSDGSLIVMDVQFRGEVLNVVRPGGFELRGACKKILFCSVGFLT